MQSTTSSPASIFKLLFAAFAVILVLLPFATTFNELLTRIIENTPVYQRLQTIMVPYMSSILYHLLAVLPGLQVKAIPQGVVINGTDILVGWNCLGWQSFLLFFLSLIVGLRGSFTRASLLFTLLFGLAGTFLVNVFRMVFTAALAGYSPPPVRPPLSQLLCVIPDSSLAVFLLVVCVYICA